MNYFKITLGIFFALSASRFIPHPPNFTSLIALSFYIPAVFGIRFIPSIVLCFLITDIIIGMHEVTFFTWGSVVFIGLISKYFVSSTLYRILGAISGACLFYIITNFGVWSLGSYGYSFEGLINCYVLAIPFFGNTLIGTLIFASIFELFLQRNLLVKKMLN